MPEAAGLAYWADQLAGGASRADALFRVTACPETIQHSAQLATSGVFTPTG
jgi:hypothetical protein